jgi:ascorbate-specific PTS system EIIC-type component UlaA
MLVIVLVLSFIVVVNKTWYSASTVYLSIKRTFYKAAIVVFLVLAGPWMRLISNVLVMALTATVWALLRPRCI